LFLGHDRIRALPTGLSAREPPPRNETIEGLVALASDNSKTLLLEAYGFRLAYRLRRDVPHR
jgi:hypothetical protein